VSIFIARVMSSPGKGTRFSMCLTCSSAIDPYPLANESPLAPVVFSYYVGLRRPNYGARYSHVDEFYYMAGLLEHTACSLNIPHERRTFFHILDEVSYRPFSFDNRNAPSYLGNFLLFSFPPTTLWCSIFSYVDESHDMAGLFKLTACCSAINPFSCSYLVFLFHDVFAANIEPVKLAIIFAYPPTLPDIRRDCIHIIFSINLLYTGDVIEGMHQETTRSACLTQPSYKSFVGVARDFRCQP
jgi:hypothetical protein